MALGAHVPFILTAETVMNYLVKHHVLWPLAYTRRKNNENYNLAKLFW